MELPLGSVRVGRDQRRERALRSLEWVGLVDRIGHKPGELSRGPQQRVAVARALVTDPALILADEPTGNLGSRSTGGVHGLFDERHAAGPTIVLITHAPDVAAAVQHPIRIRDSLVEDAVGVGAA